MLGGMIIIGKRSGKVRPISAGQSVCAGAKCIQESKIRHIYKTEVRVGPENRISM